MDRLLQAAQPRPASAGGSGRQAEQRSALEAELLARRDDEMLAWFLPEAPCAGGAIQPARLESQRGPPGRRVPGGGGAVMEGGAPLRVRRPASAGGGARRVRLEVRRREELFIISRSLTEEGMLQRDIEVGGKALARGLRLLREGSLRNCRLLRPALEILEPWVTLTFERSSAPSGARTPGPGPASTAPVLSSGQLIRPNPQDAEYGGIQPYDWACPACGEHYPVQAPAEVTASSLISRLLPEGSFVLDGRGRDLWTLAELDLPPGGSSDAEKALKSGTSNEPEAEPVVDARGHTLMPHSSPNDSFQCSLCGQPLGVGSAMRGCMECFFFMCAGCYLRALDAGGGNVGGAGALSQQQVKPLPSPEEQRARSEKAAKNSKLAQLSRFAWGRFDLSPVLHFGSIRCLRMNAPEVQRFCKRDGERLLLPLADPYDYYARAAILHSLAPTCTSPDQREQVLHEAREALLAALEGAGGSAPNALSKQQFGFARTRNPKVAWVDPRSREECAASDPRVWYLLGLVLCDLGAFREACHVYRQALARLPAAYFGHVVHFNLAGILARQPGEANQTSALRELKEFRRHCSGLQGLSGTAGGAGACALCGSSCARR